MTSPMSSTTYLVDTNVISELVRPAPNDGVVEWAQSVKTIALSVVSVEEIAFGLSWKPNARILAWFTGFLETHCLITPVTAAIAQGAGQLRGRLRAAGAVRTQADMLIAATAQTHQLTLVTRNVRDFEGCGVALLNPFR